MAGGLRFVHLDDDENDRTLVADALAYDGIECAITPAWSRETFEHALDESVDLLLVDFAIPGFNGIAAQELARRRCPDVPLIFVSGSIGEEGAVERLRAGATDYVLKHRLEKLAPAVRRAIREASDRRERDHAERALRQLNAELEQRVEERTRSLQAAMHDLEQARASADRANLAKSEFLSRMSHDLRTPLNAVLGFAQLLELELSSTSHLAYVHQITAGGQHLLALIDEILDLSRIEAGRLGLTIEDVDLTRAIDGVVTLIRPLASRRGIAVAVDLPATPPEVRADARRLNQILMNLLSNAVKYNREQGRVRMLVESPRARVVRVVVEDTGAGLTADQIARLFTPFERLGAEATGVEGTGLGLAVVKGLVEAMTGTVGVESTVGVGSRFWIDLPQGEAPAVRSQPAFDDVPAVAAGVAGDLTVLYIEDNPANTFLVEAALHRRPAVRLATAATASEGLERAQAVRPGLILLDLNLPDMPGIDVLAALKAMPVVADVPVVVLSADAMPASKERLLAAGAFAYLTKPINVGRLLEVVDGVARSQFPPE